MPPMQKDKNHKIIFRLSALGDVVLSTGVINFWAKKYGWTFTYITKAEHASIIERTPHITNIIRLQKNELKDLAWNKKASRIAEEYNGYDLIDLHGTLRSSILALHWKGKIFRYPKFGIKRRLYNLTGSKRIENELCMTNVPQRYSMAIEKKAPEKSQILPKIFLEEDELARARDFIASSGLSEGFIALHPYATHPDKTWPPSKWTKLIGTLESQGLQWVVIGKDKTPLFGNSKCDLTNSMNLRETCALLKYAEVLVTNDSGPMHLAAGVETPVVALFGPTCRAWGFYPAGEFDKVLEKDLPCRPCSLHGKNACEKGKKCLNEIEIDDVLGAVKEIAAKKGKREKDF